MASQWATKRKLSYLVIIIILLVIVAVVPTYFVFHKTPTCFDGVQNQNEKGVDCGGACTRLCPVDISSPIVLWQRSFSVTNDVYNVVAYIQNPNILMQAVSVPYIFRLYDENNVLIGERTGSTFIPANQTFAIFEAGIRTGSRVPVRTSFSFTQPIKWIQNSTTYKAPDVVVSGLVLSNELSTPRIDAVVKNSSLQKIGTIEAIAIVYNAEDNAIASSRTIVENLAAGNNAPITFTWPVPFSSSVVRKEIILRTYPTGLGL